MRHREIFHQDNDSQTFSRDIGEIFRLARTIKET